MSFAKKKGKTLGKLDAKRLKHVIERQRFDKAYQYFEQGNYKSADEEMVKWEQEGKLRIDALSLWLEISHRTRNVPSYTRIAIQLARLAPDDPDRLVCAGGGCFASGMLASAMVYFSRYLAVVSSGGKIDAVREQMPKIRDALSKIAAGEDIDDKSNLDRLAWTEETLMWLGSGRFTEVLTLTHRHLERFPGDTRARNNRAEALFQSGKWEESLLELQRAIETDPSNFYSVACRCRILFLRGMKTQSDAEAKRLETMSPRNPSDLTKAAEAYAFRGDDQLVLAQFDRLHAEGWEEDSPQNSALLYHFAAVASARIGDFDLAQKRWKRSLQFISSFELAKANLEDLSKPIAERSGCFYFSNGYWFDVLMLKEISKLSVIFENDGFSDRATTIAQENAIVQALHSKYPHLETLIPALLDRSDWMGQMTAIELGCRMESDVVRESLVAFLRSERGSDSLRYNTATNLMRRGFLPAGQQTLFMEGKPTRVEILDFKINDEPNVPTSRKPEVEQLADQGFKALRDVNAKVAEMKLRRATELEPDAPDLWNNLAMALLMQGRKKESDDICENVSNRWPDYFFGRTAYANRLVLSRHYEKAFEILDELQHRDTFHRTEFVALCKSFIVYFAARKEKPSVRRWFELLEQVAPDDLDIPRLQKF